MKETFQIEKQASHEIEAAYRNIKWHRECVMRILRSLKDGYRFNNMPYRKLPVYIQQELVLCHEDFLESAARYKICLQRAEEFLKTGDHSSFDRTYFCYGAIEYTRLEDKYSK